MSHPSVELQKKTSPIETRGSSINAHSKMAHVIGSSYPICFCPRGPYDKVAGYFELANWRFKALISQS